MSGIYGNNPNDTTPGKFDNNTNDKNKENGEQENEGAPSTGESNAYGDPVPLGENKNGETGEDDENNDNEEDELSAPERDKAKGDGKANTLMEVFWNDVIMEAYKKCIDFPVDTTLDFIDWALFAAYTPKKKKKKAKPVKKDIWDYGRDVFDKYAESAYLCMGLFKKAHVELMENIERAQVGLKPTWTVWPGKRAPEFFEEFVEYAKKAKEDPNSPEAKKWKKITSMPETMEGQYKKELLYRSISVGLATMEVALSKEPLTLPPELLKKVKEMDKISATAKNGAQYKESMKLKIREMKDLLRGDAPINAEIRKNLTMIENTLSDPKLKASEKVKKVNQILNVLREASPAAAAIDKANQEHYENIRQNVEKIKEKYKDNPEQAKKCIVEYIKGLAHGYKETQPIVAKYIKHSLSGRAAAIGAATGAVLIEGLKKTGQTIKELTSDNSYADLNDTPGDSSTTTNSGKSPFGTPGEEGAEEQGNPGLDLRYTVEDKVRKLVASVNGFKVENTEVGQLTPPETPKINPFKGKLGAFSKYKELSSSR